MAGLRSKYFPYSGEKILEKKYTKWFDCDKIKCGLSVRTRKTGDYLIVGRDGGRKKLTRCMIDDKISEGDQEKSGTADRRWRGDICGS